MDHAARALPLVPPHRRFGLEVPQPAQPQGIHYPSDGRERSLEGPGNAAERAALVPEVHGQLQLLRIERPPLGAAHAPSIRQCRDAA